MIKRTILKINSFLLVIVLGLVSACISQENPSRYGLYEHWISFELQDRGKIFVDVLFNPHYQDDTIRFSGIDDGYYVVLSKSSLDSALAELINGDSTRTIELSEFCNTELKMSIYDEFKVNQDSLTNRVFQISYGFRDADGRWGNSSVFYSHRIGPFAYMLDGSSYAFKMSETEISSEGTRIINHQEIVNQTLERIETREIWRRFPPQE